MPKLNEYAIIDKFNYEKGRYDYVLVEEVDEEVTISYSIDDDGFGLEIISSIFKCTNNSDEEYRYTFYPNDKANRIIVTDEYVGVAWVEEYDTLGVDIFTNFNKESADDLFNEITKRRLELG